MLSAVFLAWGPLSEILDSLWLTFPSLDGARGYAGAVLISCIGCRTVVMLLVILHPRLLLSDS